MNINTPPSSRTPLTERVQPLLAEIRERASDIEAARQTPTDIIQKLVDIGFYRAMAPAMYGGDESDPYDWVQTSRLLASADMSVGWVAGVTGGHTYGLAYFDKQVQDEVWATGPDTIMCTSGTPTGKVERVEGGIRLSGKFGFASGVDHAAWAMLGFVLPQSDSKPAGFYFCMVPRSDYSIEDDWHMSGMRGTGSKSILVDDAFVPEHRWFGPGVERGPTNPGLHKNPLFNTQFPYFMAAPFVAVIVGGAEGALEAAISALKSRISLVTAQRTADYPPRQIRLAEAALEISAARALMDRGLRELVDATTGGRSLSAEGNRWRRAEDAYISRMARRAVDHLLDEAGGGAQAMSKPLQRFWRDIHTGSEHPQLDVLGASHVCGRLLLGLPLDEVLII